MNTRRSVTSKFRSASLIALTIATGLGATGVLAPAANASAGVFMQIDALTHACGSATFSGHVTISGLSSGTSYHLVAGYLYAQSGYGATTPGGTASTPTFTASSGGFSGNETFTAGSPALPDTVQYLTVRLYAGSTAMTENDTFVPACAHAELGSLDGSFGAAGAALSPVSGDSADIGVDSMDRTVLMTSQEFAATRGPERLTRFASNGSLDSSYGTNGTMTLPAPNWYPQSLTLSDGSVVAAGTVHTNNTTNETHVVLTRVTPTGALDTTFGSGGTLDTGFSAAFVDGLSAAPNGRLYVSSTSYNTGQSVVAVTPSGAVDTTFAPSGSVPGSLASAAAVAVDAADNLLVRTGPGLQRYSPTGQLDTTFGNSGTASADGPALAVPDGYVVAVTDSSGHLELVKLTQAGALDPSFGSGGSTQLPTPRCWTVDSLTAGPSGGIYVSGDDNLCQGFNALVYAVTSTGQLNEGFVATGAALLDNYRTTAGAVSPHLAVTSTGAPEINYYGRTSADADTAAVLRLLVPDSSPQRAEAPTGLAAASHPSSVSLTWSAPAATGGLAITGYNVYRSTVAGSAGSVISTPTTTGYVDTTTVTGTHYFYSVTAETSAGEGTRSGQVTGVTDTTAPSSVAVTAPVATTTLSTAFTVAWTATDAGSGVASYDVRYSKAAWNGSLTAPTTWRSATTARSAAFSGAIGYEYCFSVRARDHAGNTSTWSGPRCTGVPLDDRSLTASTGWSRLTGSAYYRQTVTQTTTYARTLTLKRIPKGRAVLVIDRGVGFGSVVILYNGRAVKSLSLAARASQYRVLITLPSISTVTTITIKTATKGKPVRIDGLLLARS